MPKTKGLTPKQETFAAEYVRNGGNASAAAKKAYPGQSDEVAAHQGWENLQKPQIAKAIRDEFSRQGVTLEKALRPVVKGLEAKTKDGADDLDKQMRAHDRWLKASMIDRDDPSVQLNVGTIKELEITFKNYGVEDNAEH